LHDLPLLVKAFARGAYEYLNGPFGCVMVTKLIAPDGGVITIFWKSFIVFGFFRIEQALITPLHYIRRK